MQKKNIALYENNTMKKLNIILILEVEKKSFNKTTIKKTECFLKGLLLNTEEKKEEVGNDIKYKPNNIA